MAYAYKWLDSTAEINGNCLRVALAAFQLPSQAREVMQKYGLPADPDPDQWYPVRPWVNVLADLEATYGPQTVYAAGLQVVEHSRWPATQQTLIDVMHALSTAHQANVRGKNVGYYRTSVVGPRQLRVECFTPVPMSFDWGLLTGVARKFRPADALRVQVVPEPYQVGEPPERKRFRIIW